MRQALDTAAESWDIPERLRDQARAFCRGVKIVVSGGFNAERITRFEKLGVPVDVYAVGSSLFDNHEGTITDYTADVVRVKVRDTWVDLAKVGRHAVDNPDLERICQSLPGIQSRMTGQLKKLPSNEISLGRQF
ncbi:hypothetical protein LARV_01282 [Longilinea arvoryzae]|uniref:Nicotinate phosphoribosyltransferase n=1 Tax=Longilinea arvoryzae TaxID=360412 RepID=A0A0S7BH59_9CHLR|nr:hypothetical protein [Longilinea arvoryzae]GAP13528.1 hypothetical protein LARV_01282 [Longilinea arvoryzae]